MAFNIETFKSNVTNIARPTLFAVRISAGPAVYGTFPGGKLEFTCKASQLPSSTIGKIQVPFMGRKINFAGDVDYQDWQCTIISDKNYTIWKALNTWRQKWNRAISNIATSVSDTYNASGAQAGTSENSSYANLNWNATYGNMNNFKCDGDIIAYDNTGHANLVVHCVGIFPYEVPVVAMSWENNDSTVDIDCTFMMDYFIVSNGENITNTNTTDSKSA